MEGLFYPFNLAPPNFAQPPGYWRRRGACDALVGLASSAPGSDARNWDKINSFLGKNVSNVEQLSAKDLAKIGLGDHGGYTAWHYWAHGPNPEKDFDRLLDILPPGLENRVAENGEHPAHRLLLRGSDEAFLTWVNKFGLPDKPTQAGDTCWHMLAWHGGQDRVGVISNHLNIEEIDIPDARGLTAVVVAAHRGTREDLDQWLLLGANPDIADRTGCTLLHHVARYGEADWYGKMLDMGADDEIKNNRNQTPRKILEEKVRHSTPDETRLGQRRYWEIAYFHKTQI